MWVLVAGEATRVGRNKKILKYNCVGCDHTCTNAPDTIKTTKYKSSFEMADLLGSPIVALGWVASCKILMFSCCTGMRDLSGSPLVVRDDYRNG